MKRTLEETKISPIVVSVCADVIEDQVSKVVTQEISVYLQKLDKCTESTLETDTQTIRLSESTIVGTEFLRLIASPINCEKDAKTEFSYKVVFGNMEGLFDLNETNGIFSVVKNLTDAKEKEYNIKTVAYTSMENSVYFSNEVNISIQILRDKSCMAAFSAHQQTTFVVIRENQGNEYPLKIGKFDILPCSGLDEQRNLSYKVKIFESRHVDAFMVDSDTGDFFQVKRLDSSEFSGTVVASTESDG